MEKPKQPYKSYKGISGNESFLLNLVSENALVVFGVEELRRLSGWKKTRLHNTLFSLKQKKIIVKIKRDTYAQGKDLTEKLFEVSTAAVIPSYISFWTALSFYGFTEQQIKPVQVVSTKQHPELKFNSHTVEVTAVRPEKFYGYLRVNGFVIAEKEKALVDSLHMPEKCGGFSEFVSCLKNAGGGINLKKFRDYLIRFNNKSMISRAGYLLEELELNPGNLQKYRAENYVKLNPVKVQAGDYNRKWNIIINQKIEIKEIR